MRYAAGDVLSTMEIVSVVELTTSGDTTRYRVRMACGCADAKVVLNGKQIYQREGRSPGAGRVREFRCQHCRGSGVDNKGREQSVETDRLMSIMPARTSRRSGVRL